MKLRRPFDVARRTLVAGMIAAGLIPGVSCAGANGGRLRALGGRSGPAPPPEIQVMTPGTTAFGSWAPSALGSGSLASLGTQGNPGDYGYTERAIAGWMTVQMQAFTGSFYVSVICGKPPTEADYLLGRRTGIKEVWFSCDNGPWTVVNTTHTDPLTGRPDLFVCGVRAQDYAGDRATEFRFVAVPWVGVPTIGQGSLGYNGIRYLIELMSLVGYAKPSTAAPEVRYISLPSPPPGVPAGNDANDGLTPLTPKATLDAALASLTVPDDAIIKCLKGDGYTLGGVSGGPITENNLCWLTIEPNDGLLQSDVVFYGTSATWGEQIRLCRIHNITAMGILRTDGSSTSTNFAIWLDTVRTIGNGMGQSADGFNQPSNTPYNGKYVTNCSTEATFTGYQKSVLAYNIECSVIISLDIVTNNKIQDNIFIHDLQGDGSNHTDVLQYQAVTPSGGGPRTLKMCVARNLQCTSGVIAQGLFWNGDTFSDFLCIGFNLYVTGFTSLGMNGNMRNMMFLDMQVRGTIDFSGVTFNTIRFVDSVLDYATILWQWGISYLNCTVGPCFQTFQGSEQPATVPTSAWQALSPTSFSDAMDVSLPYFTDITPGPSLAIVDTRRLLTGLTKVSPIGGVVARRPVYNPTGFNGAPCAAMNGASTAAMASTLQASSVPTPVRAATLAHIFLLSDQQEFTGTVAKRLLNFGTNHANLTVSRTWDVATSQNRLSLSIYTVAGSKSATSTWVFEGPFFLHLSKGATSMDAELYNAANPTVPLTLSLSYAGSTPVVGGSGWTISGDLFDADGSHAKQNFQACPIYDDNMTVPEIAAAVALGKTRLGI